ncbi:OLC1v1031368C1 [Oldenlandia corymbosa var. corymbosa]|uniref:OLC1v1031368C1 n=1 Tax=Oldenlandia corymbosa var. corymbosa TaxID=529605 RepID=A0AAV1CK84_OLDCO|nr:OLC1v1031368C1 [Oldenlandia corymbosa var. corymbosa]
MSQEWVQFDEVIDLTQDCISREVSVRSIETSTADEIETVFMDLRFLCTFIGYFDLWRRHAPSSSFFLVDQMDWVFEEAKAVAKEIQNHLQHAVIERFDDGGPHLQAKFWKYLHNKLNSLLVKLEINPKDVSLTLDCQLVRCVNPLKEKIAALRPRISCVYQGLSLYHLQPEETTSNYDWNFFRLRLQMNIEDLKYMAEDADSACKALTRSLNSMDWLLTTTSCSGNYYRCWSPWKEKMMTHQFVSMILHVAHFYCLCWLNPSDFSYTCVCLESLHNEMVIPTPEFLDIILGSLTQCDNQKRFLSSFVDYIVGIKASFQFLREELFSLFTCFIKISELKTMEEDVHKILLVGIRDIIVEAGPLKSKKTRAGRTHYAILLAKIWFLKAEFFIKSSGIALALSKDNHVQSLCEGCRFLQQVPTCFQRQRESPIFKVIEGVPDQVNSLYQLSPGEMEDNLVHVKVSIFLLKCLVLMMLIKANALLLDSLEGDASLQMLWLPLKDRFKTLQSGLLFLIEVVSKKIVENIEDEKPMLTDIKAVATGHSIEKHEGDDIHMRLVDTAYQTDHAISSVLNESKDGWQNFLWLDYLLGEIRHIKMQLADSDGNNTYCDGVHDVVRDLCLLRAADANFLKPISIDDEPYSSFNSIDHNFPLELLITSNERTYEENRLCFRVNREHFVVSRPSGPFVRSLLFFPTADMYPRRPYDLSFIPINFRSLRVLDLESINMGASFADGIQPLVDLRYLAVCGDMESVPSSLSNLENLETLLVKSLKSKVMLPETIWSMRKLRHICVTNCAVFTWGLIKDEMHSLVSLSFPCFTCGKVTDEMIMRFPNLRKLRCIVLKPRDISVGFFPFPSFRSLCKLESLNISYYGQVLNAVELNFPSSVKKLTLSNFRLPRSHISLIGRLPKLEVLKLKSKAFEFEGSSWTMEEGEFLNLKYLKLDTLDIVLWDASSDNLPRLQQLIVRKCMQLEEIPFDFVNISTLVKIEVQQCGMSVEESVKRIGEEEIEGLQIVINNSHSGLQG